MERIDKEYQSHYILPVTLRQVLEAGIQLNSEFGATDAEHQELLDEQGLMRLRFGVVVDCSGSECEVCDFYIVETFSQCWGEAAPTWSNSMRTYSCVSGNQGRILYAENDLRAARLVRKLLSDERVEQLMTAAREHHEDWLEELYPDDEDDEQEANG